MIVDDSLTVRTIFKRMIESDPALAIAGTAASGERAIAMLAAEPADVVLLDLEMPGMGGLQALPRILATSAQVQVLVVSSLTKDGAEHTLAALAGGAADTLLKPHPGGFTEDYRAQLVRKIRALGNRPLAGEAANAAAPALPTFERRAAAAFAGRPQAVAIGASTGGIHALGLMLRALPRECDLPILITQHLPPSFIPVLARQLETSSGRPTDIAADGALIRPGRIMLASGEAHLLAHRVGDHLYARLSQAPAPSGCLPSVDPMLESLSFACNGRALAVILSGMGRDGFEGAGALVAAGGTVFAQDAETSAVWGMPGAVARAGLASVVAAPQQLGEAVAALAPAQMQR